MHSKWWLALLVTDGGRSPGWIGTWSPGIGDPNVVGWLTVVLYLVASVLCFRAARGLGAPAPTPTASAERAAAPGSLWTGLALALALAAMGPKRRLLSLPAPVRARALWFGLAIVLVLLGFNKQLDLQTALTELGRKLARAEGWYHSRHRVQAAFLAALTLGGLATVRVVFLLARAEPRGIRSVLTGAMFLVGFVLVRAACFQYFGELLHFDILDSRLHSAIEICGILFIIVGTARVLGSRHPTVP
jgi:hypothetical protein